ncbi:MAG: metallophosphoesterase [Lachnospiraceae bacterium]|nr:metallophosphoesterase [Lachnospiraceae bacterium]
MIWLWIALIVIAVLGLTVILISIYENRTLTVSRYQIESVRIPEGFSGKKIVLLADLHNACFGKENERLIRTVEAETPDYIVLAGDMIVSDVNSDYSSTVELLRELSKICPVYYAKGNHELRVATHLDDYGNFWDIYKDAVKDYVTFLDDASVTLFSDDGKAVRMTGLDTAPEYYKRFRRAPMESEYLERVLGKTDENTYEILIAHHPAYYPDYVKWGADLVLSGHIHGGMVRLPLLGGMISPMVQFFPKYDRGRFDEDGSTLLLSGGLGNHTLRIRVNNLPEIVVADLHHASPERNKNIG